MTTSDAAVRGSPTAGAWTRDRILTSLNPRRSFTARLTLVIVSLVVATVMSATFFTIRELRSSLVQQAGERSVSRSEWLGQLVNLYFLENVGQVQSIALAQPVLDGIEAQNLSYNAFDEAALARILRLDERWANAPDHDSLVAGVVSTNRAVNPAGYQLTQFLDRFAHHSEVFVTDRYGGTVAATGRLSDYYQADEEWWRRAWNHGAGAVYISDPERDESAGVIAMLIAVPVRDAESGDLIGVLRSTLDVSTLFKLVELARFGQSGHAELISRKGEVLATGLASDDGHHATDKRLVRGYAVIDHDGDEVIQGVFPVVALAGTARSSSDVQSAVDRLGWTAVVEQDKDEALSSLGAVVENALLVSLIAAAVAFGLAVVTAQAVTRPLIRLTHVLHEIGRGNLSAQMPSAGHDEIGQLASSFAAMTRRLNETIGSLKERTNELVLANEELRREVGERERVEERIHHLAYHDALTGLPNRALLKDRLGQALSQARRNNENVAVLFIDLDRFKKINDSSGHLAGDGALSEIADRIARQLREGDTVARVGGDEFAVVLPHVSDASEATRICSRILEAVGTRFAVGNREFQISASIGMAMHPRDGDDVDLLLRSADIAMYRAKARGVGAFETFSPEMNRELQERLAREAELRRAVDSDEITIAYQPRLESRTGRIVGMEALARWQHPDRGTLLPFEFIPMAEEVGLIGRIGESVLLDACRQAHTWLDAGLPPVSVSVNLSARQFQDPSLAYSVAGVLIETGLPPELLELEITEGVAMENPQRTVATIADLRPLGVKFSLDDFGTGYSSMSYVQRFHVDALKVDRSFMAGAGVEPDDSAIVAAIMDLAASLRLRAVAEGVETEAQLTFLNEHGCDEVQGFLFSQPLPAAEITALLEAGGYLTPGRGLQS